MIRSPSLYEDYWVGREVLFERENLSFRTVEKSDLNMLKNHRNDFSTWRNLTSPWPVYNQDEWFANLGKKDLYLIGQCRPETAQLVQDVALLRIHDISWTNRNCAIGIDVFKQFRGEGLGKRFFHMLGDYCFDILNMHRLWLLVVDGNEVAKHIYESYGFKEEGRERDGIFRDGVYKDYILMGILENERNQEH